jgi:hypothetical protein
MTLVAALVGARRVYRLFARGALTIDIGVGRRLRELGPVRFEIAAPREVVLDVIASPYPGRTPHALKDKLEVWERGTDIVLAAQFTEVKCGVTTTVEIVRFERPERIDFRVLRGPVPTWRCSTRAGSGSAKPSPSPPVSRSRSTAPSPARTARPPQAPRC